MQDVTPAMYADLAPWYPLITPVAEYQEEAQVYLDLLQRADPLETLLELGCGAGHNAWWLKRHARCTLTDVAPGMLALSEALNPECDHALGDMRTLRLDRRFDAVLIHDAIGYMTTRADLLAALQTAWFHLRPGGVAVIAPDHTTETWAEQTEHYGGRDAERVLHVVESSWGADPERETCRTEYVFLLRDAQGARVVHDTHVEGMFPRQVWLDLLDQAGFQGAAWVDRVLTGHHDQILTARRA